MKLLSRFITYRFEVCLSKKELQMLLFHSANHLNKDYKQASEPKGFLQFWAKQLASKAEVKVSLSEQELNVCGFILEKLESSDAKNLLENFRELYRCTNHGKLPPCWATPSWIIIT